MFLQPYFLTKSIFLYNLIAPLLLMYRSLELDISLNLDRKFVFFFLVKDCPSLIQTFEINLFHCYLQGK